MNKFLRYSLSVIFAFVASVGFAQTTFDFDNDHKSLFPDLPGVSTIESHDGDFNKATTCTVNGIAVTVSAKEEGNPNDNRIWTNSARLRMYSGTLLRLSHSGCCANIYRHFQHHSNNRKQCSSLQSCRSDG